ncbi:MAG: P-loop NTPase fold protein [Gemmatimonadota bacterium]
MWSDNEAVVDLLNVKHLVGAVLRVVKDDRLDPVTVGVYGDWGSGKSSVIQLLLQEIATEPDLLAVYFNGWRFEGYEDTKAALASTILEQIQGEAEKPSGKLKQVKDAVLSAVTSAWSRVDKLRLGKQALAVTANAGIAVGTLALGAPGPVTAAALTAVLLHSLSQSGKNIDGDALAKLIKEREDAEAHEQRNMHELVRDFRKEFGGLIGQLGVKRLVVIVDDLDRCLPQTVLETLEAIRLFLAVPKTAFVIAADEALIREAVAYRYPEAAPTASADERPRAAVGTRYLEKLIQVPVRVPPLSRSDLQGYLNLLFAEERTKDAAVFAALCDRVRKAASYDAISFHAGNAEELLGEVVSDELKTDFLLAEQIAPVLALCAEGNPRQTKRFLNALVLRLDMATDRGVELDRPAAAKLLLLEYFMPTLFRALALDVAANEGRSVALAALEHKERAEGADANDSVDTQDSAAVASSTFTAQAAAMRATDRFLTWVHADPPLGDRDLRPYVYFANERYALPVGLAQRLSVAGSRALAQLLGESEAEQAAAAGITASLPIAEVTAILGELTARARSSGVDLQTRTSPLHAMVEVAKQRPDVAPDVIAAILGMPYEVLPPGAALLVASLATLGNVHESALRALRTLREQTKNAGLKAAAQSRLTQLEGQTAKPARR